MGYEKMDKKFDVSNSGQHQLCLQNQENNELEAEITIKTGEFSADKSEKITAKHLAPVELEASRVDEMIKAIREDMHQLIIHEDEISGKNSSIKTRVFVFGIISIAIMSVSTFLQIKYLKNFFRYKKII